MHFTQSLLVAFAANAALALASSALESRSTYPFDFIVGFGDELSDNGSGSYAHGITGNPASVYGADTWTNGKVALQYLAEALNMPLSDFAFGGCCGGASFGATLSNSYTNSPAGAQDLVEQISNFTHRETHIQRDLAFVWIGMNDVSEHTDAFWLGDGKNEAFARSTLTACLRLSRR